MSIPESIEARVRGYAAEHTPSLTRDPASSVQPPAFRSTRPARPNVAVLAVSGGGDSVALASVLCEAGIVDPPLTVVAHFDHGWRGEGAAARDRGVVEALCERYGLHLATGRWDAPRRSEAAARDARYAFLLHVAREHRAGVVATGHTEDDHVETVMLNMARGAGTYGLAGIAPERRFPRPAAVGLMLARPLLGIARQDTRAYCDARGLAYVDDESNEDRAFARNRVRAILAEAYEETPEARAIILQTAAMARASVRALEASVAGAAPCAPAEGGRALAFDRAALRAVPDELAIYAWRPALERLLGDAREFGRRHFETLARAHSARTGSVLELPRGVVVTVDASRVLVSVGPLEEPALDPGWQRPLPFAGVVGAWDVVIAASDAPSAPLGEGWGEAEVIAHPGAVLRAPRPGDRIASVAGGGHRKLQDAYVDAKVPRRLRPGAPVLADADGVFWTPLLGAQVASRAAGVRWRVRWRRRPAEDDGAR